jgi:hypothetical protein
VILTPLSFIFFHPSDKSPILTIKCYFEQSLIIQIHLIVQYFSSPFFRQKKLLLSPLFTFQSCFQGDGHVLEFYSNKLLVLNIPRLAGICYVIFFCCSIIKQGAKYKERWKKMRNTSLNRLFRSHSSFPRH